LVYSRRNLETGVGKELLKVLNGKIGYTNVLDTSRLGELLELRPGVEKVPVWQVFLEILRVGG
jgi:hypothetical protein